MVKPPYNIRRLIWHLVAGQMLQVTDELKVMSVFRQGEVSAAVCEPLLQVAELKTKLDAAESFPGTLEKELPQSQRESDRQQREEKEKESLNEELHELKRENKLLKEKNALANQKKQHFECEIKRLNKALQDALKMECSSSPEDCLGKSEVECSHEEMRTEMEVLKQQ
ncbi:TNFAIP3-interacting protein 3, partial [Eschrichtius robustus]|nr:TNFAIP3-interacting protein 3 [Eschrichtius robustus]